MTIQPSSLLRVQTVLTILMISPSVRGLTKYPDAKQLLTASPWTVQVAATMDDPADVPEISDEVPKSISQAGQPNQGTGNLDINTRWDGQIGRNRRGHLPTVPVMVRWDSAAVVRHALEERQDANVEAFNAAAPGSFILTVVGLLPARAVKGPAKLDGKSSSDDAAEQVRTTEEILEWFMGNSLILVKGQPSLRPQNARVDPDSGTVHLFFNRNASVLTKKPDLEFVTRYGTINVQAKFHVKAMQVDGKPDL
jgi:hypothetical protein